MDSFAKNGFADSNVDLATFTGDWYEDSANTYCIDIMRANGSTADVDVVDVLCAIHPNANTVDDLKSIPMEQLEKARDMFLNDQNIPTQNREKAMKRAAKMLQSDIAGEEKLKVEMDHIEKGLYPPGCR